jgi:cobaltochelatase CobS
MARSNTVKRRFFDGPNSFDVFDCQSCGKEFSRPTMRGVKPFDCPECAPIVAKTRPVKVSVPPVANVPTPAVNPTPANPRHYRYSLVLAILKAGVHVFLVGPAGSGKTTLGRQIAEDMGLAFYAESGHELMTAYDLLGFRNANGEFVVTSLYKAVEEGGVFLMDEMDAMNPAALVAVNNIAALSPGNPVRFGDREVKVHPDFRLIAGGNTWGRGANGAYVTRQVIDAATLDRFACIEFGYDEHLEYLAAGVPVPAGLPANPRFKRGGPVTDDDITSWVGEVQKFRKAFVAAGIEDAMVTPRASIAGSKMLRAGIHKDYVMASLIRKGLSDDEWRSVKAQVSAAA